MPANNKLPLSLIVAVASLVLLIRRVREASRPGAEGPPGGPLSADRTAGRVV